MKQLMINEDFADVTLVTEDKKHIKANIGILSACSPVFKDFLNKDKNASPIMYLRGIQYSELESIMQFIYLGEATVSKERMDELLAVAKSLEIKGLCKGKSDTIDEPDDKPMQPIGQVTFSTKLKEEYVNYETIDETDDETLPIGQVTSAVKLKEQTTDQIAEEALQEGNGEGVSVDSKYECEPCQKIFQSKTGLYVHKKNVHQGVKYSCDECDYQATRKQHLTVHIQSRHEGVKYPCDQCDYQATTQGNLTVHIQSKHEGIEYACDHCDRQFTQQSSLGRHIKTAH